MPRGRGARRGCGTGGTNARRYASGSSATPASTSSAASPASVANEPATFDKKAKAEQVKKEKKEAEYKIREEFDKEGA